MGQYRFCKKNMVYTQKLRVKLEKKTEDTFEPLTNCI